MISFCLLNHAFLIRRREERSQSGDWFLICFTLLSGEGCDLVIYLNFLRSSFLQFPEYFWRSCKSQHLYVTLVKQLSHHIGVDNHLA